MLTFLAKDRTLSVPHAIGESLEGLSYKNVGIAKDLPTDYAVGLPYAIKAQFAIVNPTATGATPAAVCEAIFKMNLRPAFPREMAAAAVVVPSPTPLITGLGYPVRSKSDGRYRALVIGDGEENGKYVRTLFYHLYSYYLDGAMIMVCLRDNTHEKSGLLDPLRQYLKAQGMVNNF